VGCIGCGFVIYLRKRYNTMITATQQKEQTAFRFETSLIESMKKRAKGLNISVNKYVTNLIENDLKNAYALPKIKLPSVLSDNVLQYSGVVPMPTSEELKSDERLERIWKR